MALEQCYSPSEVAAYFGISPHTVYDLIRTRRLEASKIGKSWRITESAAKAFLERNQKSPPQVVLGSRKTRGKPAKPGRITMEMLEGGA